MLSFVPLVQGFFTRFSIFRIFHHFALILLIVVLSVTAVYARSYEAKKKVGDFEIDIRIDKNPIVQGKNHIEMEIRCGGKLVKDAAVWVNYYMPPMPRMAPMNYKTEAKLKGEKYKAAMDIIMAGPWIIVIKIYQGEKRATTKLNLDAQ